MTEKQSELKLNIGVFAYNFKHEKTELILRDTLQKGFNIAMVWLAPKVQLGLETKKEKGADDSNQEVMSFCKQNGIPYRVVEHSNTDVIRKDIQDHIINLGLVTGARIIHKDIIDLFGIGIVNYHPGKIPETSGLDSFYYSILKDVPLVMTAHLVNHKVDEGRLILEKRVDFLKVDSVAQIRKKNLISQVELNSIVLEGIEKGVFKFPEIYRPSKNTPLSQEQRDNVIQSNLEDWKSKWGM